MCQGPGRASRLLLWRRSCLRGPRVPRRPRNPPAAAGSSAARLGPSPAERGPADDERVHGLARLRTGGAWICWPSSTRRSWFEATSGSWTTATSSPRLASPQGSTWPSTSSTAWRASNERERCAEGSSTTQHPQSDPLLLAGTRADPPPSDHAHVTRRRFVVACSSLAARTELDPVPPADEAVVREGV